MINVIIDFSGSMRPNGKFAIVRNTCVALNMTAKCRFFSWSDKIEEFTFDEKFDWFSQFSNKVSISVLEKWVETIRNKDDESLLLLTDGSFSYKDKKELENYLVSLNNMKYAIISIGADALAKTTLSCCKDKIFSPNETYLTCEYLSSEEYSILPKNLDELSFIKKEDEKKSGEGTGDEWE